MKYDCQTCGACCSGLDVLLDESEAERFERDRDLAGLTVLHDCAPGLVLRFMKKDPQTERCLALAGSLEKCACTIYEQRPVLCRELHQGAPDCVASRQRQGLPI
jgi:uncharacterized protein